MNWLANAFANDDTLGEKENAGLKNGPKFVTGTGPNGKTVKVSPGSKLEPVSRKIGVKVQFGCQTGSCRTCEALVDGKRTKICIAKVPNKDFKMTNLSDAEMKKKLE